MDAVRNADDRAVTFKRIKKSVHPHEVEIGQYLSSPPLNADPLNHCCPILDVLQDPHDEDIHFIVMPFLRFYNFPDFETVGEVIEFLRQSFEVRHRPSRACTASLI